MVHSILGKTIKTIPETFWFLPKADAVFFYVASLPDFLWTESENLGFKYEQ